MPESKPIFINGSLEDAARMAGFMILVSVILAVVFWIIFFVYSALAPKKESFTDQQLASQTLYNPGTTFGNVPMGRSTSQLNGVPAGRDPLFND